MFNEYIKSKLLYFLNQSLGHAYDNHAYDEDYHLHFLEPTSPTQNSWVLDPS